MKAMIFAAGLGTRLMPMTLDKPKALVELNGKPLLQILIEKLLRSGIREIIVNVHHHSDQIMDFLHANDNFGVRVEVSDESSMLLETGGGINKVSWFFDDGQPFLVHNVDVISGVDLNALYADHLDSGALVTLAVKSRETSRYLLFDDDLRLCGWQHVKAGKEIIIHPKQALTRYAFSGIHVIDPAIFEMITETGKFSIIDTYLRLAKTNTIRAYPHNSTDWMDVGKPEDLLRAGGQIKPS